MRIVWRRWCLARIIKVREHLHNGSDVLSEWLSVLSSLVCDVGKKSEERRRTDFVTWIILFTKRMNEGF